MSEKHRVVIATTEGPAEVERLSEEDPAVGSVICLQCKAIALPVSPAYDSFVRRPTGIVEAAYGHSAYRLDVSAPISGGFSWQLGALAAHGLQAGHRLAGRDDHADRVLWVTGEVDQNLNVLPVAHLAEKLNSSAKRLSELADQGVPVTLCVPRENLLELGPDWRHLLGPVAESLELLAVEQVAELFTPLGLETPTVGHLPQTTTRAQRPWRSRRAKGLALAFLACLVVLVLEPGLRSRESDGRAVVATAASRETPGLELAALEARAPPGSSCAAVQFGSAQAEIWEVPLASQGPVASADIDGLCGLRFRLTNRGAPGTVWLVAARAGDGTERWHSKTILARQPLASNESHQFEVTLPRRLPGDLMHSFAIISDPGGLDQAGQGVLSGLSEQMTPDAWQAWANDAENAGLTLVTLEHRLSR